MRLSVICISFNKVRERVRFSKEPTNSWELTNCAAPNGEERELTGREREQPGDVPSEALPGPWGTTSQVNKSRKKGYQSLHTHKLHSRNAPSSAQWTFFKFNWNRSLNKYCRYSYLMYKKFITNITTKYIICMNFSSTGTGTRRHKWSTMFHLKVWAIHFSFTLKLCFHL